MMSEQAQELAANRVLVVGGAGFVGSNLVRQLLAAGSGEIVVIDNLLSAECRNIPSDERVSFINGSITDDAVLGTIDDDFDYIFQLATFHGNQSSINDPLQDHENNTLTTLKLCERIKGYGRLKKIVYASAGCTVAEKTFDDAQASIEDAKISLYYDSPYQISKIIGELYLNYYYHQYALPCVKARFQNVYGPGEILGAGRWRGTPHTVWRNVTPTFVYRALKNMPLLLDKNGAATRDFIYVEDIARGLMLCASRGTAAEVYNLASGVETSIRELAELIVEMTSSTAPLEAVAPRTWDRSGKRYGSTEKSDQEIGFSAAVDIRTGLERTIAWTRENLSVIETCIDRHAVNLAACNVEI